MDTVRNIQDTVPPHSPPESAEVPICSSDGFKLKPWRVISAKATLQEASLSWIAGLIWWSEMIQATLQPRRKIRTFFFCKPPPPPKRKTLIRAMTEIKVKDKV